MFTFSASHIELKSMSGMVRSTIEAFNYSIQCNGPLIEAFKNGLESRNCLGGTMDGGLSLAR